MATVFDLACEWATTNFPLLEGKPQKASDLIAECNRLAAEWPGIVRKKWLFIYSPSSANALFEVRDDLGAWVIASSKLASVARYGGMLFGADFSKHWATKKCIGTFTPLVVCKPTIHQHVD